MDSALNETKHVQRILVGICSGDRYSDRRQGVRETWSSRKIDGIECRFFVGGTRLDEEPDVTVLDVDDSYEYLPAKVKAFSGLLWPTVPSIGFSNVMTKPM